MTIALPFVAFMGVCLVLTIIIETLGALILGVRKKNLWYVVLAQILTNPLVVSIPIYVQLKFGYIPQIIAITILEIFAIVAEAFLYKKVFNNVKIKPFLLSLILNASSFLIGLTIESFIRFLFIF